MDQESGSGEELEVDKIPPKLRPDRMWRRRSLGGGLIDRLIIATAAGCGAHLAAAVMLPNAKKLSTARMQKFRS